MSHHYLEFKDVHYQYPGGVEALRGISFRIDHGEKVALLGRNGAGKSTLLLHTNGLLLPTSGQVNVGGIPVSKRTLREVRRSVGMVFQNPDDQLFMPTVEEDVAFGPLNMGLSIEDVRQRVSEALRAVSAEDLLKRPSDHLSGGQKRRIAIATVLSMTPSVFILDEPTSNLDWSSRRELIDLLGGFLHTCLIATHDLDMVRELCPRTIAIDGGRVIADGPTDQVFADTAVMQQLGILS